MWPWRRTVRSSDLIRSDWFISAGTPIDVVAESPHLWTLCDIVGLPGHIVPIDVESSILERNRRMPTLSLQYE
jgi:hypothetical protein